MILKKATFLRACPLDVVGSAIWMNVSIWSLEENPNIAQLMVVAIVLCWTSDGQE
jgi:hypothetical protein